MSLTWQVTDCVDWQELVTDAHTGMTTNIVFATMAIGIGHITEKNWQEFAARLRMSPIDGIADADVKHYIGLRTNVSYEPTAKWLKRMYENHLSDVRWKARNP